MNETGGGVGRVEGGVGVVQWGSRVGVLPKRLCVYMWICIVWPCREREQSESQGRKRHKRVMMIA